MYNLNFYRWGIYYKLGKVKNQLWIEGYIVSKRFGRFLALARVFLNKFDINPASDLGFSHRKSEIIFARVHKSQYVRIRIIYKI